MKAKSAKLRSAVRKAVIAVLLLAAFSAGYLLKSRLQAAPAGSGPGEANQPAAPQKWYCSMDPQIIREGPGKCPLCGMALVPMPADLAVAGAPRQLVVSEEAAKLMEIETSLIERKFVAAEIRMVGKIDYDETRVKHITAWVPGRIDRLYVDFKGTRVNKGDHMVYLYSKELLEDQQALLAAVGAAKDIKPGSSSFADRLKFANAEAVRKRLKLRGLTDEQIAEIEKGDKPLDHITIYAPMGVKIKGPDLETIDRVGLEIERLLKEVPSVEPSAVIADRIVGKPYLEIDIDREAIARYGINILQVQEVIEVAIGGRRVTTTVEGRERYPVRIRYMRELRDSIETLGKILVPAPGGPQIPLIQLAEIRYIRGPQAIKSEDTFLIGYVLFDMKPGRAEVDVVEECRRYLEAKIDSGELVIPEGVNYAFAGSYENQVRAQKTLSIVIPLALFDLGNRVVGIALELQRQRTVIRELDLLEHPCNIQESLPDNHVLRLL